MKAKIALTGNSSIDPRDPNYDGADSDSEDPSLQECEQKIEDLESRVAALEQKAGIGAAASSGIVKGVTAADMPSSKAPSSGFYGG